jgi:UDP-glucose-4-epimerase GalE
MNVLVTGGAGYVGSHTCKALASAGFTPVVFDDLSVGHRDFVRWGPLVVGDIADVRAIRGALRHHGCRAIVHFAAHAYVGESIVRPRDYFRNNVTGSLRLLEAALDEDVLDFVFSSSCATYGIPPTLPITEDSPQVPINPYGDSKLFVEKALAAYGGAYGLRWVALRYFNAAGADEDGEIGERHDPETHLIPLAVQAALGLRGPLEVMGTQYSTADGTAIRDYVHVTDLAAAHVLAVRHLLDGNAPIALNLGTGRGYSVLQIVEMVSRLAGAQVPTILGARRQGDPPILVANASRARRVLGWEPTHSALDDIVRTAIAWMRADRRKQLV